MDSYKTIREVFALWKKEKQMYVKQSTMATYELHISKHIMPAAIAVCFMKMMSEHLLRKR